MGRSKGTGKDVSANAAGEGRGNGHPGASTGDREGQATEPTALTRDNA
jgi:hypothetical protein